MTIEEKVRQIPLSKELSGAEKLDRYMPSGRFRRGRI